MNRSQELWDQSARPLHEVLGASILPPIATAPTPASAIDIELFAGAGGMTLGLSMAGLVPQRLYETNKHCCSTLRANATPIGKHIAGLVLDESVEEVDWSQIRSPVRLLSGGPPCQPFSLAGKHRAARDERNQFPATLRAIRELNPDAVLLENVPGLTRPTFERYLQYILRQLECPSIAPRDDETWQEHNARIAQHQESKRYSPEYHVRHWLLNAADFGVPQARVRFVIVATRSDHLAPSDPVATHSRAALMHAQETGTYWEERGLRKKRRKEWPKRLNGPHRESDGLLPWTTVRDALQDLGTPPKVEGEIKNHWLIPGARLYKNHSGSELDWPAKTIKAGVHGVAGGENVLVLDRGRFRYFTLREMARLQGFPDSFVFEGPRSRIIGQIGNAVPCELARALGESVLVAVGTEAAMLNRAAG
jgi:DNA (cytosine-5)-methyltransferase 1